MVIHYNLEDASRDFLSPVGETKGIFEPYKAWRAFQVDIDNNNFPDPFTEAADELYYQAAGMLKSHRGYGPSFIRDCYCFPSPRARKLI